MNKLSELNKQFNESLESFDNSFQLTKAFFQKKIVSNTVNTILISSVLFGALKIMDEIPSVNKFLADTGIQINKDYYENFEEPEDISFDKLVALSKSKEDGVYQFPKTKQSFILTFDKKFETDDIIMNDYANYYIDLQDIELGQNLSTRIDNMYYISIVDQEMPSLSNRSLLNKNKTLFVLSHELSHLNSRQTSYYNKYNHLISDKKDANLFSPKNTKEATSDLFAISVVIKDQNLSINNANQLIDEVMELRRSAFLDYQDVNHITNFALITFKNLINDNVQSLDRIKKMNIEEIDNLVADVSESSFKVILNENLENKNYKEILTIENVKKDVSSYIKEPEKFDIFTTEYAYQVNERQSSQLYGQVIDSISKKIENGFTFEEVYNSEKHLLKECEVHLYKKMAKNNMLLNFSVKGYDYLDIKDKFNDDLILLDIKKRKIPKNKI